MNEILAFCSYTVHLRVDPEMGGIIQKFYVLAFSMGTLGLLDKAVIQKLLIFLKCHSQ